MINTPDPFRAIAVAAKSQCQETTTTTDEQIKKLQIENKELKKALANYKYSHASNTKSATSDSDKELVYHLSEQVGITTQLNLELTSKLKLAEGEIDSYKRILQEYQNEISDMKVKHLNEASEYTFFRNQQLGTVLSSICFS